MIIFPIIDAICFLYVFWLGFLQDHVNVESRLINLFNSNATFEYHINIIFTIMIIHNSRAINEIDALGQCDVLPDSCFSWNRCTLANFFLFQGVDNGRFSYIRISNETNTDMLLVFVQIIELSQQINQRSFSEGIVQRSMVCKCRIFFVEISQPFRLQNSNEICKNHAI
jgi:hypothetical protein